MNRFRWIALCACTLGFLFLSWSGLPPRRPLVPGPNLPPAVEAVLLIHRPRTLCARLEDTALVAELLDSQADQREELSEEGRKAGLPPLTPPLQVPPEKREQLHRILNWLQPTDLAVVMIEAGGNREIWLGIQGGRTRTAGRFATWFAPAVHAADSVWIRIEQRSASHPPPALAESNSTIAWARNNGSDLELLLPRGLPPTQPAGKTGETNPLEARVAVLCRAAGLPANLQRGALSIWVDTNRLRWAARVAGNPAPSQPPGTPPLDNPPALPQLPSLSEPGVFLAFHSQLNWPLLYHNLVDGLSEEARADFLRSMRYYRLAQKGYRQPEADLIDPLGCGVALVGRRGLRFADQELMPSFQAEIPLRPAQDGLAPIPPESPNRQFRSMMPDFAEARFDKIRRVGETSYSVHPSYVAVTTGTDFDRYVLIRPSIAGSALLPAWQVDETRIKIGTRPDVLSNPALLKIASRTSAPGTTAAAAPPLLALYFDPSGITDQLDKFRILLKVEAGAERPMPDEGLSVERIEIENQKIMRRTAQHMKLSARIGWILKRLGPLTLEVRPAPADPIVNADGAIEIRGMLELKSRE